VGPASASAIFRLIEEFGGTLVRDEAGVGNSEMEAIILKVSDSRSPVGAEGLSHRRQPVMTQLGRVRKPLAQLTQGRVG